MAYATAQQVYEILAQALTTATSPVVNGQPVPLWRFGKERSSNVISDDTVNQSIVCASDQIDASISELYVTPLEEKTDLELRLIADIDAYNNDVQVDKPGPISAGDILVFIDSLTEERAIVSSVSGYVIILDTALYGIYMAETTRVLRVKFPPTINLICARLAAANLYDKFFASQANPNISDYGKNLRKWALSDLNSILQGIIILHGQKRIGHRFFNPTLRDRYGLPGLEGGDREMKGGDA